MQNQFLLGTLKKNTKSFLNFYNHFFQSKNQIQTSENKEPLTKGE